MTLRILLQGVGDSHTLLHSPMAHVHSALPHRHLYLLPPHVHLSGKTLPHLCDVTSSDCNALFSDYKES